MHAKPKPTIIITSALPALVPAVCAYSVADGIRKGRVIAKSNWANKSMIKQ